jgi:hypothetical protein
MIFGRYISTNIDGLCGSVGGSSFTVPQDSDPDGTYATGWLDAEVDVADLAGTGKPVTLALDAHDVGDSIYDSVVLLDKIELVK